MLYLPEAARFSYLLNLPEGKDIGREINEAMALIEQENPELKGVLPKTYQKVGNDSLATLLKTFNSIPLDIEGDAFGKIYEYFLGEFAKAEGQKGGEFFTPTALVKLIVEIIEPFHGRIYDPACGSDGMFVQSAGFVSEHQKKPLDELTIFGEERVNETIRLCKMNLAVHGLSGGSESLADGPGIIVGRKGNVGSIHWTDKPFFPIDTVYYVKTGISLYYAFYNLQNQNFINNDAAVPGLNRNQAYALPFLLSQKQVLDAFDEFCAPIFCQVRSLSNKNQNLRQARDLLLPKLISGEVEVSGLEMAV